MVAIFNPLQVSGEARFWGEIDGGRLQKTFILGTLLNPVQLDGLERGIRVFLNVLIGMGHELSI